MVGTIYICSAGFSGSTLLDLILGSHKDMISLGEISHLSKNWALNTQCTCGETVQDCELWSHVVSKMAETLNIDVYDNPYGLALGQPDSKNIIDKHQQTKAYLLYRKFNLGLEFVRLRWGGKWFPSSPFNKKALVNNLLLYDLVRERSGASVVIDSSKSYIKAMSGYLAAPASTRIVLLTRDGRGVMYSNARRGFDWRASAQGWVNYYRRALDLIEKNLPSNHLISLKYEDLALNPVAEIKRLCQELDLVYDESMLKFSEHAHHITNGNDMRFKNSSAIRLDTTWHTELSEQQLAYFERRAGKINRLFGYQ